MENMTNEELIEAGSKLIVDASSYFSKIEDNIHSTSIVNILNVVLTIAELIYKSYQK